MRADQVVCLGILFVVSVIDMKYCKIPIGILAAMNAGAFIFQFLYYKEDKVLVAGGIVIGAVFLFISRVTGEGIGYGDSLGILGLGAYLGLWKLFEVLSGAFFLLALCSVIVLVRKKMSRKIALPFYPFLTAGYVLWMIGEIRV